MSVLQREYTQSLDVRKLLLILILNDLCVS